jgi:hypothetical protein
MADQAIKKATVPKADLPAFNGKTNKYSVRYRIVSDDKNRYSQWSPYYYLPVPSRNVLSKQVQCSVTLVSNAINMVWSHPTSEVFQQYDIYIRTNLTFDPTLINDPYNGFSYVSSSSSTQFSTLAPAGISWYQVAVQIPTYPKKYFIDAAIFTSTQKAV